MRATTKNHNARRRPSLVLGLALIALAAAATARPAPGFVLSPPKRELTIRLAADDPPARVRLAGWYCFPSQVRDYLLNKALGFEQERLDPYRFVEDSVQAAEDRFKRDKLSPRGFYYTLHHYAQVWHRNLDANLRVLLTSKLRNNITATVDAPPGGKRVYLYNCYTRAEIELYVRMVDYLYNSKLTEFFRNLQHFRRVKKGGDIEYVDMASGLVPLPPGGLTDGKPAYDQKRLGPITFRASREKYPERHYRGRPPLDRWKPRPIKIVVYRARPSNRDRVVTGSSAAPPDAGWRVAGDNGRWCTYWGWKKKVPWTPEGGIVVPREEPKEKKKRKPRPEGEETPGTRERPPVTVERPHKPKKRPQPEGKPQPERPPVYVKAKKAAVREGAKARAVAGFQLKLLAPAPALPLAGNRRDDSGYDEPPIQATTGKDGTAAFPAARRAGSRRSARPASRRFALSFGDLIAEANAAERAELGRPVEIGFEIPDFESYTVKVRIDRSLKRWYDPEVYLLPPLRPYVVRHWRVGDVMYVVVNVPSDVELDEPPDLRKYVAKEDTSSGTKQ